MRMVPALIRVLLVALVLLAPAVAPGGAGAMWPAQHDGSADPAAVAMADAACPGGDCGTACPSGDCLSGPCSVQLPGLAVESIVFIAGEPARATGRSRAAHGQRLLPATPPPRL